MSLDGFDDVAVFDLFFFCRTSGLDRDHSGVSVTLGDIQPDLGDALVGVLLVGLVLFRGQVAGIRIQRLEQTMQGTDGDLGHVGIDDVVGLNLLQDLAVDFHLGVGAILLRIRAHAARTHSTEEDQRYQQDRDSKNGTLEGSGHSTTLDHKDGLNK